MFFDKMKGFFPQVFNAACGVYSTRYRIVVLTHKDVLDFSFYLMNYAFLTLNLLLTNLA